jgi:glutaredoxin-like protein
MALFDQSLAKQLRELLATLPNPVSLLLFTNADSGDTPCETCREARELIEALAALSSGKVRAEVTDVSAHPGEAAIYGIDKVPAIVVLGDRSGRRDFGVRFFGTPDGYEFATLVEDIRLASTGTPDLSKATLDALGQLTAPMHIQVFVTPTCPYCPRAASLAHRIAMASDWVTADAVDATEFPELARRYQVYGVPRTVIDDRVHVEGAVPEADLVAEIMRSVEAKTSSAA